jgi:hypothetical protein
MIATLKMPFAFDAGALKRDLGRFSDADWTPHFNTAYYEGDWSGLALRAARGATLDLYPDPVAARGFENTALAARCEYLPEVLAFFQCELETVRFLRLGAGSRIIEHRDYGLGFEHGAARLHVPVETGPRVEFLLDRQPVSMREGEAWYLNFNLPHSVENRGERPRVHLVVDCVVNDWLRGFFAAAAE